MHVCELSYGMEKKMFGLTRFLTRQFFESGDVIVQITSTAICGSDLHLYDGYQPSMEEGDIMGHEPMGVVVEVGKSVTKLRKGDRVVVPFVLACGHCFFCQKDLFSCCDTSNPTPRWLLRLWDSPLPDCSGSLTC